MHGREKKVLSDEVTIKIIDSIKEIILELIKRSLPANIQIEQRQTSFITGTICVRKISFLKSI